MIHRCMCCDCAADENSRTNGKFLGISFINFKLCSTFESFLLLAIYPKIVITIFKDHFPKIMKRAPKTKEKLIRPQSKTEFFFLSFFFGTKRESRFSEMRVASSIFLFHILRSGSLFFLNECFRKCFISFFQDFQLIRFCFRFSCSFLLWIINERKFKVNSKKS